METIIKDIEFTKGDTYAFGIKFNNLDQSLDTCYLTCRIDKDKTSELLFQKSLVDGIEEVETEETNVKKYRFRIAPEDTANLELSTYYYDIEIGLNSDIYTIYKGKLKLTWEVTD